MPQKEKSHVVNTHQGLLYIFIYSQGSRWLTEAVRSHTRRRQASNSQLQTQNPTKWARCHCSSVIILIFLEGNKKYYYKNLNETFLIPKHILNYLFCFWHIPEHYKGLSSSEWLQNFGQNIFTFSLITFRIPQIFIFHTLPLPLFLFSPALPIFSNCECYFRAHLSNKRLL